MEEAGNELMLLDDELVPYVVGECFVHLPKDQVEEKLEQSACNSQHEESRFFIELCTFCSSHIICALRSRKSCSLAAPRTAAAAAQRVFWRSEYWLRMAEIVHCAGRRLGYAPHPLPSAAVVGEAQDRIRQLEQELEGIKANMTQLKTASRASGLLDAGGATHAVPLNEGMQHVLGIRASKRAGTWHGGIAAIWQW